MSDAVKRAKYRVVVCCKPLECALNDLVYQENFRTDLHVEGMGLFLGHHCLPIQVCPWCGNGIHLVRVRDKSDF